MFRKFLTLEWRAFVRSASFAQNLFLKILMGLGILYFMGLFILLGAGSYYIIKEEYNPNPLEFINKFLIYYVVADLLFRLLMQKIPVMNIKPLLVMPIKRSTIVNFALTKTMVSAFNTIHWFFFLPFFIVLLIEGHDPIASFLWMISIMSLIYFNNSLNIILNSKDNLFYVFMVVIAVFAMLQYYDMFDITDYTIHIFNSFFDTYWAFAIPLILAVVFYRITFSYLMHHLHLDTGLSSKPKEVKSEQFDWLNRFGSVGTFVKNDIRLIKRNKRSRATVIGSVMFLFYGLFFFTGIVEVYDNPIMHMFAAVFVTGGFLFTFGQFVPSWDSAYYNLMMTQNIPYRDYLSSKWWLIVIATFVSTILAAPYLYFGVDVYLMILAGAVYNMGINSHLVLLGGAYTKTAIDLNSGKKAFGDKKAFNAKTLLLSLPKLLLPMLLYGIGAFFASKMVGFALVAVAGFVGFALREKVFTLIERIYKTEKYSTIQAYKQNND